jgi:hypothetical protein
MAEHKVGKLIERVQSGVRDNRLKPHQPAGRPAVFNESDTDSYARKYSQRDFAKNRN